MHIKVWVEIQPGSSKVAAKFAERYSQDNFIRGLHSQARVNAKTCLAVCLNNFTYHCNQCTLRAGNKKLCSPLQKLSTTTACREMFLSITKYCMGCRLRNASLRKFFFCLFLPILYKKKKKKEKKVLLPAGVSKSAAHTVLLTNGSSKVCPLNLI